MANNSSPVDMEYWVLFCLFSITTIAEYAMVIYLRLSNKGTKGLFLGINDNWSLPKVLAVKILISALILLGFYDQYHGGQTIKPLAAAYILAMFFCCYNYFRQKKTSSQSG